MLERLREKARINKKKLPEPPVRDHVGNEADARSSPAPVVPVLKAGSSSERGEHERNEDSCAVDWQAGFYAVSDGIGGAPDGDYMSRVSVGAAKEDYARNKDVAMAFKAGNSAAIRVSKWISNDDCGATLLLAAQKSQELEIAWAGDSALFRLRDGALLRLTSEERESGTNVLLSAVGYDEAMEPSVARSSIKEGDVFLMCTDGVWAVYKEQERMGELIQKLASAADGTTPIGIARDIVFTARLHGYDDATAIVIVAQNPEHTSSSSCELPATPVLPNREPSLSFSSMRTEQIPPIDEKKGGGPR